MLRLRKFIETPWSEKFIFHLFSLAYFSASIMKKVVRVKGFIMTIAMTTLVFFGFVFAFLPIIGAIHIGMVHFLEEKSKDAVNKIELTTS